MLQCERQLIFGLKKFDSEFKTQLIEYGNIIWERKKILFETKQ